MALKKRKPTTKSNRFTVLSDFAEITRDTSEPSLTVPLKSTGGRGSNGRLTVRHRGGGHKRQYRLIDFRRDKDSIPAKVAEIEYDPNRSSRIALLHYADGEKRYILAPVGLGVGDTVMSGPKAEPKVGNAVALSSLPLGSVIHNLELTPGRGAQMVRGAGGSATLMSRDGEYCQIKLPSGEIRLVNTACKATVGRVGNTDHESRSLGKAGRSRWLGRRPTVRGVVMNPVDHPMGGGEGRTSGGGHPVSPWGKLAKGKKTRRPKKQSKNFIVSRRK